MNLKTASEAVFTVGDWVGPIAAFQMGRLGHWGEQGCPSYRINDRSHYSILFIEPMQGHCVLNNIKYDLRGSTNVICAAPNGTIAFPNSEKIQGWALLFTEHFFALRYHEYLLSSFPFLRTGNAAFLALDEKEYESYAPLLRQMFEETKGAHKGYKEALRSYLNILLLKIGREDRLGHGEKPNDRFLKIIMFEELIERHFVSYKHPSWYASQMCISPNYLNRICKEVKGMTSGEVIRHVVIREAKRLLCLSSLQVSEIGHRLGFGQTSHFVTFFKKLTMRTPESFRKTEEP